MRTERWLICIGGFRQREDDTHGMAHLHQALQRFERPGTQILLLPWNYNWRRLARRIANQSTRRPVIDIYAFSYGGGWGAQRLSERLRGKGLLVHRQVLADPVFRSAYFLCRWRALLPARRPTSVDGSAGESIRAVGRELLYWIGRRLGTPEIVIPPNVRRVTVFRQSLGLPMAHDIRPAGQETVVDEWVELQCEHTSIDTRPEFVLACLEAAAA